MNRTIKELIRQAGGIGYDDDNNELTPVLVGRGLEKFAELLVRECAGYMNGRTEDWDAKLRWIFNDGSGYMEVEINSLLNEHFGIEE
jgi:hypothetical protein